ncbi:MAG: DUF4256 domain-containing protein [Verrucomicrobia bacterium]|nr:DUF4256 domain-containing protein [Verrucomicrobiota bacterium]
MSQKKNVLGSKEREQLLETLQRRFEKNMPRHEAFDWHKVKARLEAHPEKLWSVHEMEATGGEPDVIGQDKYGAYIFVDCSAQSPERRVSLCYDDAALAARKEHKPKGSAVATAEQMGVELLTEDEYFALQKLGEFDTKRSSWIKTPPEIRKQGGALWCGRSYGRVFVGSNGADSYFRGRGFRASVRV